MQEREKIKAQLGDFAAQFGPAAIVPAVVKVINDDDTIEIEFSDGSIVDDARLKSVVADGNKVVLIPKVESVVLVGRIENSDEYVVIAVSEVIEFLTEIDDVKYAVTADGFLIKKDNDTLKQILTLIVEAIQPIVVIYGNNPVYAKLTQALTKINNLLQ